MITEESTQRLVRKIRWADNIDLAYKAAAVNFIYWTSIYLLVLLLS